MLPSGNDKVAGATLTETATAEVTVRLAAPVNDPLELIVALIVAVPSTWAMADPVPFTDSGNNRRRLR